MITQLPPTKRLFFRLPNAEDLAAYTAYCASPRAGFVGGPYNDVQAFEKLATMIGYWSLRGFGRFVFATHNTGRPIGHMGALQLCVTDPVEMTWTIWHEDDEGQGYATEACSAYLAMARQSLPPLLARMHPDNTASQRLAERLGGTCDTGAIAPIWLPKAVTYAM